jgi:hypothetical protein
VRAVLALTLIPLAGCSSLLGIEDPSPGNRDDGGVDATDAPSSDHLVFNVGDFQLAQLQSARLHVTFVHRDGTVEDATTTATYASENDLLATVTSSGVVTSGSQSGSSTITAMLAGALPAAVRATVKTTLCHPVINELTTGSVVPTTGAADEYVELYNPCTMDMDVNNWTLNYRGPNTVGTTDSTPMATLTGQMMPGELRVYAGVNYTGAVVPKGTWPGVNGVIGKDDGAVGLRAGPKDTGTLVDSIAYGTVATGHPFLRNNRATATVPHGRSASRLPFDGKDDGDGAADFMVSSTLTPGALNAP